MDEERKQLDEFFTDNQTALEAITDRYQLYLSQGDFYAVSLLTAHVSKIIEISLTLARQIANSQKVMGNA